MMVLFVSQCEKKALQRTRRVLDAFADRIGDNTWRTVITEEGLQAVYTLLKKSASKNTAVACHWLRGRSRCQLLWVVGRNSAFDATGRVPVNRTAKPFRNTEWENSWQHGCSIQIMATLAALLHDLGKSSLGFQNKLFAGAVFTGDPYRHEWISLRLFEWLLSGVASDAEWLERFCTLDIWLQAQSLPFLDWTETDLRATSLHTLPPLAQWLAWLIVSHHRLPFEASGYRKQDERQRAKTNMPKLRRSISDFYARLEPVDYWVRNPKAAEEGAVIEDFWSFDQLVLHSPPWQKQVQRWAKKALGHPPLLTLGKEPVADPLLLHLSRLALMLGDYNYSSLPPEDRRRIRGSKVFQSLAANTCRGEDDSRQAKQSLDEHLLGVARYTARFARQLPALIHALPALANHDPLIKPTASPGFLWQNKACDLARSLRQDAVQQGFFGINMASTGCGKTIGNARIVYALADPRKGARFTIALGLRVLTLQTGQSFRKNLALTDTDLAVLVGGAASRDLFQLNQAQQETEAELEQYGSSSVESLIPGLVDSGAAEDLQSLVDELGVVIAEQKARDLLCAPVLACTIDHLMQASECKRGGQYIIPWLRLLTSDIILDEPDDFNQEDLPALARFVHLAGLCGSRILLSSATLSPDFVIGLFEAYQAGRVLWNKSQNFAPAPILCAWFDEKRCQSEACPDKAHFGATHQHFVQKRAAFLKKAPIRRMGAILPLELGYNHEKPLKFYLPLAEKLVDAAISLHQEHHLSHPESGQTLSIGLMRMANISPLMGLALALHQLQMDREDIHIHLCSYHARQLLLLRSELEEKLDRILQRDEKTPFALFAHPEINQAMQAHPAQHHICIVLASPVAEIGRDHDYDWAIVEPSSMRSLIQLAGRIGRHRPGRVATQPNLLVWQYPMRALREQNHGAGKPVFYWPGFEDKKHLLNSHDCSTLFTPEQLAQINASARIVRPDRLEPGQRLADLEHQVMRELLNNEDINFVNAYWRLPDTANRASAHLQLLSPFRAGRLEEEWVLIPQDDGFAAYYAEQIRMKGGEESSRQNHLIQPFTLEQNNRHLSPWLTDSLAGSLERLSRKKEGKSMEWLASRYATVQVPPSQNGWCFHEWFGFWQIA